jgi:two-component system LytT family sensor kinase
LKRERITDIYPFKMKMVIDIKRLRFYLWVGLAYLLIWILYDLMNYPETFSKRAVNELWRAGYIIAINYLLFEYGLSLIKFTRKKILRALLAIAVFYFLFSFGLYAWRYFGIQLHIWTSYIEYLSILEGAFDQFSAGLTSIIFFGVFKHIYDHIKLKQATQQLRIEKQEAELNYLKSQTNPHFLFNTLNNIYSLAKDKSDLAPESILRLSKILRFMLYETSGAYISIEQEVKIITDYIALEKLRYDKSLRVSFKYDIENMQLSVPPLLLIPLVENAFKHGVSETRNEPFIDIRLSADQQQLKFFVKNSTEEPEEWNVKENIGLSNLRRQLLLLYTDYNLSVQQKDSAFTATLNINLKSHV